MILASGDLIKTTRHGAHLMIKMNEHIPYTHRVWRGRGYHHMSHVGIWMWALNNLADFWATFNTRVKRQHTR
jgi:hypothetical protein